MYARQTYFLVILMMYGVFMFLALVHSARRGDIAPSVLIIWLASPVLLAAVRLSLEREFDAKLISPKTQAWSFLFGDTISLPIVAGALALGWRSMPIASRWYSPIWTIVSAALGICAGLAFHLMAVGETRAANAALSINAPTKLAHDFVAYPVIFGGLACIGVPVVACAISQGLWPWHLILAIAGVLSWVGLVVHDVQGLDPKELHPQWSTSQFRVIPYDK
ncbi:MAG: hypothetical protein ABIQ04_00960 [Candidatus Saccharimonadales bacterium]